MNPEGIRPGAERPEGMVYKLGDEEPWKQAQESKIQRYSSEIAKVGELGDPLSIREMRKKQELRCWKQYPKWLIKE